MSDDLKPGDRVELDGKLALYHGVAHGTVHAIHLGGEDTIEVLLDSGVYTCTDPRKLRRPLERGLTIMFAWAAEQITDYEYECLAWQEVCLRVLESGKTLEPEYAAIFRDYLRGAKLVRDSKGHLRAVFRG